MGIDWNKVKNNAKAKDNQQYEAMKAATATKNPVIRELNGDAARERKEKQAQIISRPKEESSARKTSENPSAAERVGKTVTGAGKGSAAGFTNLGGVVVEGLNKVGTYLQSKKDAQQAAQDREYLAKYEQDLKDAIAAGDAKAEKTARLRINSAKNRLKTNGDMTEYYKSVGDTTAKNIYDTADALAESSQKDISRAKQGAGKVGQFAVDVGVAGTQMTGDIGLALLTGGSALAPMAARSFGSGAQKRYNSIKKQFGMDAETYSKAWNIYQNDDLRKNAQGAGTIRKRADGRWEARFTTGFDPASGKQVQKSIYGRTQKEVREKLAQITTELDDGTYMEPTKDTVSVLAFCLPVSELFSFVPLL